MENNAGVVGLLWLTKGQAFHCHRYNKTTIPFICKHMTRWVSTKTPTTKKQHKEDCFLDHQPTAN
jgi:hypothetical protein